VGRPTALLRQIDCQKRLKKQLFRPLAVAAEPPPYFRFDSQARVCFLFVSRRRARPAKPASGIAPSALQIVEPVHDRIAGPQARRQIVRDRIPNARTFQVE